MTCGPSFSLVLHVGGLCLFGLCLAYPSGVGGVDGLPCRFRPARLTSALGHISSCVSPLFLSALSSAFFCSLLAEREDEREREKEEEEGERGRKEEREVRRLMGERVTGRRRPAPARTGPTWARPGGWRRLDPLLDRELRRGWSSGAMHGRLRSASSSWCGGRRLLWSCGRRRPQRVGDDTCSWCSTHEFRHSSKRSGRIRPGPIGEKTEYRDEPLEHVFMGCSRARWRSSPEGRRAGRRGGEEGGLRGACTRSSRRPSVRCSSGCSLPALGLRVQRRPHRPLLPLAHRPIRGY